MSRKTNKLAYDYNMSRKENRGTKMKASAYFLVLFFIFSQTRILSAKEDSAHANKERPIQIQRLCLSAKAALTMGKKVKSFTESQSIQRLSKLHEKLGVAVKELDKTLEALEVYSNNALIQSLRPSTVIPLTKDSQVVVNGSSNTTMLHVKNRFAFAGITTREEMKKYLRFYQSQVDADAYLKGLLFVPVTEQSGKGEQVFIVLPNPFYKMGKANNLEQLRPYLIENIFN